MKVCVIGAGASGLIAIKELKEQGHEVTCYEKDEKIGGVFFYSDYKGGVYDSTKLTISNYFMAFSCYFPKNEPRDYWTRAQYAEYLHSFIKHFNLHGLIRCQNEVKSIYLKDKGVNVDVHDLRTGETRTEHYDSVCICSGTHQIPKKPEIKGTDTFQGEIHHSYNYKNAKSFKNKRVLTIGIGETAADVVHEICEVADDCILSIRHKQPIIARYPYARPHTNDAYSSQALYKLHSNVINKIHRSISLIKYKLTKNKDEKAMSEWNLAIPNFINHFLTKNDAFVTDLASGKLVVNESGIKQLTQDSVIFNDKSEYKIDTIMYNTGYRDQFDIIKDVEINDVRSLYKHMIHPKLKEKIVFIGWARPAIGGVPACSEMQSRYYAKLLSKDLTLPQEKELHFLIFAHKQFEEAIFKENINLRTLVHYEQYLNDFAQILGCMPQRRVLLKDPMLWFKIHYGSHLSFIYRLSGSGSSPDLAKSVIKRLPVAWSPVEILILMTANLYSGMKRVLLRQKDRLDYT